MACDQLLEQIAIIEKLQSDLDAANEHFLDLERQLDAEQEERLAKERENISSAEAELTAAEADLQRARERVLNAQERHESVGARTFAKRDRELIDNEIKKRTAPIRRQLAKSRKQRDKGQSNQQTLKNDFDSLQRDLAQSRADLQVFENDEIPHSQAAQYQRQLQEAESEIDGEIREAKAGIASAKEERTKVAKAKQQIETRIQADQAKKNELERVSQQGIISKLASSAWWGSFGSDYQNRIDQSQRELETQQKHLDRSEAQIRKIRSRHDALKAGRDGRLDAAAQGIMEKLRTACKNRVEALPAELETFRARLEVLSDQLDATNIEIEGLQDELQRITSETTNEVADSLLKQATAAVESARKAVSAAEDSVADHRRTHTQLSQSLATIASGLAQDKESRLREAGKRTTAARIEVDKATNELRLVMGRHGIDVDSKNYRKSVVEARKRIASALDEYAADHDRRRSQDHGNRRAARGVGVESKGEATVDATATQQVTGNLFFDFAKNEDDNQDNRGRTFDGLRTQLEALRKRHGNGFFQDIAAGEDLCAALVDAMFPEGVTQSYFICNLSLRDEAYLSIRPQVIGPRLERIIPRGMSLAICGRLWDNRDPDNPVFLAQRIVNISHSSARPFERQVSGFVFSQEQNVYPAYQRQQNILSNEFIQQLPAISVETRSRLDDWRAYLDWKERLTHARLVGLRYLSVDFTNDRRVRFLTVCESQQHFDQVRRTLRSNELYAYGLNYSQDPWEFDFNEDHRGRGAEVGDFAGQDAVRNPRDADTEGIPWESPFFAYIYYRLPEDAQNEFDGVINSGGAPEEAAKHYLRSVHPKGFLALSVVGDIALIRRQRSELKLLQEQSGFAPFLSSYLFDISAANKPDAFIDIDDDQWLQSDLNDDQRLAVRKMVSTPDLAMVQGPPGTGKTTMIAEATWQFVHQGKKVLLVSQASLAVNNALERLAQIPSIRAIRLSRRERKNEREHPYSQAMALETYYRSIASACSERTLDVWSSAKRRQAELAQWIANAELINRDAESLRKNHSDLCGQAEVINKRLSSLKDAQEAALLSEQRRIELKSMKEFLAGCDSFRGTLPDEILNHGYEQIIERLNGLRTVGIQVNSLWPRKDYGTAQDRSRFMRDALLNWRTTLSLRSQLAGDIERLSNSDGDTVMSPEMAAQLSELKRKLDETHEAMIEDASKVTEWQAIQRQMRELRHSESGLSRDLYARLFNAQDNDSLAVVTNSHSGRAEVLEVLTTTREAIDTLKPEIEHAVSELATRLQGMTDSINSPDVNEDELRSLQGESRDIKARISETAQAIKQKEERRSKVLEDLPADVLADEGLSFEHALAAARRAQESLESQLAQSESFRESWEGILKDWVSDLQNGETIRCDQDNFFDTYVSSCNVVGMTCTESRRTLEETGHTWFDAVIVDEVSKATPTEIIMPVMTGRTAILVGDHRQLPPLFKEHEGSWEEAVADQEEADDERRPESELTAENFERFKKMVTSSLFKEHFENAPDPLKSFLFTQYRMHPQIMRVVNQFYENRLKCGLDDPDGKDPTSDPRSHRLHGLTLAGQKSQQYIVPDRHVAWLDSTLDPHRREHHERRDLGEGTKVNELECILIAKSLCDIELSCREQGHGSGGRPRKQVGVVTFYARQVRAIREAIRRAQQMYNIRFSAIDFDINTVDRYQGQERPIILVSLVRNPPFKLSQRANTAQFERINVAFSRAQELLIIAGAKDVFCKYPVHLPHLDKPGKRKVEVYRYIIDEIQRMGGLWPSDYVVTPADYDRLLPNDFNPQANSTRARSDNRRRRQGRRPR